MTQIFFEKILQELLQKKVRFLIKNKIFREGRLILFKSNCFSYELLLLTDDKRYKKMEIPIPFNIEYHKEDNLAFFDYRFMTLSYNNDMLNDLYKIAKKCKSKFNDIIMEVEISK